MNALRHALLARDLIARCGGLKEAEGVCRLRRSRLSSFQNWRLCEDPKSGQFMPMDVVDELEAYCGEPVYSAAVAAERPAAVDSHTLLTEACEISEHADALLRLCRLADQGGAFSVHERRLIEAGALQIEQEIRELRAAAHGQGRMDRRREAQS